MQHDLYLIVTLARNSSLLLKVLADSVKLADVASESEVKILRALCGENPLQDKLKFQKQIGEDTSKTYEWVSADEAYTKWLNEDNDPVLWVHGEDGQGKTPLTISLINALTDKVERSSQQRALAYFFCAAQDHRRNNVTAMIRVLLYQLLCQRPNAFKPWLREYGEQGETFFSHPNCSVNLWKVRHRSVNIRC